LHVQHGVLQEQVVVQTLSLRGRMNRFRLHVE
jgi:hypothetical protein